MTDQRAGPLQGSRLAQQRSCQNLETPPAKPPTGAALGRCESECLALARENLIRRLSRLPCSHREQETRWQIRAGAVVPGPASNNPALKQRQERPLDEATRNATRTRNSGNPYGSSRIPVARARPQASPRSQGGPCCRTGNSENRASASWSASSRSWHLCGTRRHPAPAFRRWFRGPRHQRRCPAIPRRRLRFRAYQMSVPSSAESTGGSPVPAGGLVKVPAARKFERVSTRRPGLARTPPARPRKLRETSRQYPEASR